MRSPGYQALGPEELHRREGEIRKLLNPCRLCPHECGVDRVRGERGRCRLGMDAIVASAAPHFGEERPISGNRGSGTVFFSSCNLACVFCQNADISHSTQGERVSPRVLAEVMLRLQDLGCHNINVVTPTHVSHAVAAAVADAAARGLAIPLVYNCGGYESVETLRLLDGIVDIYMPDLKYSSNEEALRYSGARSYWDRARAALVEMHRQVGDLRVDDQGLASRGLLIRHLVMPGDIAGSARVFDFIAREISTASYVNVMDQYRPCYRARGIPELARPLTRKEYRDALAQARRSGLWRGFPDVG